MKKQNTFIVAVAVTAAVIAAFWLLLAIPAVMAYNLFHRRLHAILERSQRLSRILLTYLHGPGAAEEIQEVQLPKWQAGRLS